ncbi:MAG: hypothetical protein WCQ90_06675 [Deltaproteobacteria bacterium]
MAKFPLYLSLRGLSPVAMTKNGIPIVSIDLREISGKYLLCRPLPLDKCGTKADKRLYVFPVGDNAACQIFSPNRRIYLTIS